MSTAVDQKAGWCAQCRGGGHDLCVSLKCRCPRRNHALRRASAPRPAPAKVVPLRPTPAPERRSADEVAAEALAILSRAGCDNCKAGNHDACTRRNCGCLTALETLVQAHGVHTVRRGRTPEPLPQNRERHARVHPTPTTKVCPRCKETKPVAAFFIKDKATGSTQSFCKDCSREYARDRYLRVTERAIAVELLEGDACIGHLCPACGKPFRAGQLVIAGGLHHERCA